MAGEILFLFLQATNSIRSRSSSTAVAVKSQNSTPVQTVNEMQGLVRNESKKIFNFRSKFIFDFVF